MAHNLSGKDFSKSESDDHFWIAAFVLDGALFGIERLKFAELSKHWIGVCRSLISHFGPVFDENLQGALSHLRIKCTASEGTALVTIYVHGEPASSFAVVTGAVPSADSYVLSMFAESVRASTQEFQVSNLEQPFGAMVSLPQRPLMVVVPWSQSYVADQNHELAKELGWHLAAALMRKPSN